MWIWEWKNSCETRMCVNMRLLMVAIARNDSNWSRFLWCFSLRFLSPDTRMMFVDASTLSAVMHRRRKIKPMASHKRQIWTGARLALNHKQNINVRHVVHNCLSLSVICVDFGFNYWLCVPLSLEGTLCVWIGTHRWHYTQTQRTHIHMYIHGMKRSLRKEAGHGDNTWPNKHIFFPFALDCGAARKIEFVGWLVAT